MFDGNFLNAARRPRYLEVKQLLDSAQGNAKINFTSKPAPFTSGVNAEQAAAMLAAVAPLVPLTLETRAHYFRLVSPNVSETDMDAQ